MEIRIFNTEEDLLYCNGNLALLELLTLSLLALLALSLTTLLPLYLTPHSLTALLRAVAGSSMQGPFTHTLCNKPQVPRPGLRDLFVCPNHPAHHRFLQPSTPCLLFGVCHCILFLSPLRKGQTDWSDWSVWSCRWQIPCWGFPVFLHVFFPISLLIPDVLTLFMP